MKTFGVIVLSIMTGGLFGIIYAISRKTKRRQVDKLEKATMRTTYAYKEFEKLSDEDKARANELRESLDNLIEIENSIIGD